MVETVPVLRYIDRENPDREMSITRASVLAAALLVSRPCCAGLFPAPANRHELVTFDHVTIPTSGRINCIVRDARGFLWLGTTKGLCRYDGYQLRVLQVGDGHPRAGDLPHHDRQVVNAMVRMADTALVLGTELGLWRFDLASERSSPLPGGGELSGNSISALAEDSAGTLWIGTL